MGPGAYPVDQRLSATRSLLQVMSHTKHNDWLGDKMRQDRYNMPIPEYHTVEIQATPEIRTLASRQWKKQVICQYKL